MSLTTWWVLHGVDKLVEPNGDVSPCKKPAHNPNFCLDCLAKCWTLKTRHTRKMSSRDKAINYINLYLLKNRNFSNEFHSKTYFSSWRFVHRKGNAIQVELQIFLCLVRESISINFLKLPNTHSTTNHRSKRTIRFTEENHSACQWRRFTKPVST